MSLTKFLNWWFSELRAVARALGGGARKRGEMVSVEVRDNEIVVRHLENGRGREIGRVPRGDGGETGVRTEGSSARESLAATVQGLRAHLDMCEVKLAPHLGLIRNISLPAAAEENLRQVLGFEMERQTPFRADSVYFDYEVTERDRKNRQLSLDLRVATRAVVDEGLAALGDLRVEQVPAELDSAAAATVEAAGPPDGVPVVLWFRPAGARRPGRSWVPALMVLNALLLLGMVAVPVAQQKQRLAAVRVELDAARRDAAKAGELQERIDQKLASMQYVAAARDLRPAIVNLIEELSDRVPDGTSLTRLEIKDNTVTVQGVSDAASSLIAILEASDYLVGVRFSSPVTRQGNQGKERFHLTGKLKVPVTAAAAPTPAGGTARKSAREPDETES